MQEPQGQRILGIHVVIAREALNQSIDKELKLGALVKLDAISEQLGILELEEFSVGEILERFQSMPRELQERLEPLSRRNFVVK